MSRWDTTGIFWDDYVPPKVVKVKEKRTPPEPTWLGPDYLPNLEEARAYVFDIMTTPEILAAQVAGDRLVWDLEFYLNYSLIGFRHMKSGKIIMWELFDNDKLEGHDREKLLWILRNFTLVDFNGTAYDLPMIMAVLDGYTPARLMAASDELIHGGEYGNGLRPYEFYRTRKLKPVFVDHIDLRELTPLGPSLKICAGRIHAPRMADLPFPAGTALSPDQITILRWYWVNDLANTEGLYHKHKTAIELREVLSKEYGVDVRSKSDPQIAEEVIKTEIRRITGQKWLAKAKIEPGRRFKYRPPSYLQYKSATMQWVLEFIRGQEFVVAHDGTPTESKEMSDLSFQIGNSVYQMGIGGLHSKEKKVIHLADENYEITDNDVTSYYPALILQQGMYPPNIGPAFLQVFKKIVDRRIAAKRAGDKATAETLKIVVNGTFGKTGERGGHSVVYYPDMMIQVTLSGQLALLMLIEWLELSGIEVISANTDGIMVKCPRNLIPLKDEIMREWQRVTELELESKGYKGVYSRDINNYIAMLEKPDPKETDGFRFAKTIGAYRKILGVYPLKWNPTCDICAEAVVAFLAVGTPVDETIKQCTDFRKFIEVRRVTGGAVKNGEYLGKAIRWYYAIGEEGAIINAKNGYDVPRSQGAKPCMTLPQGMPPDIDFEYYVNRALKILDKDFVPKGSASLADDDEDEDDEEAEEKVA